MIVIRENNITIKLFMTFCKCSSETTPLSVNHCGLEGDRHFMNANL
jgi:hypothetical protein